MLVDKRMALTSLVSYHIMSRPTLDKDTFTHSIIRTKDATPIVCMGIKVKQNTVTGKSERSVYKRGVVNESVSAMQRVSLGNQGKSSL